MLRRKCGIKSVAYGGELPDSVKEPVISRFDMNAQPVVTVALSSDTASLREISIFVEDVLKPRLQKISGVGQLTISGREEREIQLQLDLDKLNAYGLSVAEVGQHMEAANQDIPGGKVGGQEELLVRTAGNFHSLDQFNQVIVGSRNEIPLYFWQVGKPQDTIKDKTSTARYDGKPAVGISVGKQSGSNTVQVASDVKKELERIRPILPEGIEMHLVRDDASRIADSLSQVKEDLLTGTVFTILIVFWFLGDWRSTVISSLAIPISIVGTFFFMKLAGFSLNTMSLLGLTLSVGLLTDDAIVVIENIIRHRQMGQTAKEAALQGTEEITLAVMAATFTVAAVFLPVGFMSGSDGQMFKEFGFSVAFAVLVSLFVSFTLTPMMAALYLPVGEPALPSCLEKLWQRWQTGLDRLTRWYSGLLRTLLDGHRKQVLGVAVALFLLSLGLIPFLGSTYMPTGDRGQFTVKIRGASDASSEKMDEQAGYLTDVLKEVPEVQHVYDASSNQQHELFVKLVPKKERKRSQKKIIQAIREKCNCLPGVRADFLEEDEKPIAVSLTGPSQKMLIPLAEQVQQELEQIPGVQDVASSFHGGSPNLILSLKEKEAHDLGISSSQVGTTIQTLLNGSVVGKYDDQEERVDIRMRLTPQGRSKADMLQQVYIPSEHQQGEGQLMIPLSQVAEWKYGTSASDIRRYDRQKEIRITGNTDGTSLGEAMDGFFAKVEELRLPPGCHVGQAGASDDMDDSFANMLQALGLAVAFIFMILAAQFESYAEPFVIMFSLPLALIGALGGLFVTGSEISLVSLIGIMTLMGLVTKNAILLVDFAKEQIREGENCNEALVKAGSVRLRPILMTTFSTIAGMVPIALGMGAGAEVRAPMGHAVIGGVMTSTVLTLVVVPTVYSLLHQWQEERQKKKKERAAGTCPEP